MGAVASRKTIRRQYDTHFDLTCIPFKPDAKGCDATSVASASTSATKVVERLARATVPTVAPAGAPETIAEARWPDAPIISAALAASASRRQRRRNGISTTMSSLYYAASTVVTRRSRGPRTTRNAAVDICEAAQWISLGLHFPMAVKKAGNSCVPFFAGRW